LKIISIPRSGATQYCIDISRRNGLAYRGELSSDMSMEYSSSSLIKHKYHESGVLAQPIYHTTKQYFDALRDPNSIWLVNGPNDVSPHLPEAEVVFLRKRYMDSFNSLANMFDKAGNTTQDIWWNGGQYGWRAEVSNLSLILDWLILYSDTPVIWYEDYFPNKPSTHSAGPEHHILLKWLKYYNIAEKMLEVQKMY
jgi:hypothetical protein